MKHLLFIAILLCSALHAGAGHTLYVSPAGDDTQSGDRARPLASLSGARDRVRELRRQGALTDTVFVRILPGTYSLTAPLTFTGDDAATAQSPVVYAAATDERPVFCGGLQTGAFEAVGPNLWRVYIPETRYGFRFEQLYVNGERRYRAQSPNRGEFHAIRRTEEHILTRTDASDSYGVYPNFSVQKIFLPEADRHLLTDIEPEEQADVLLVFNHVWTNTRKYAGYVGLQDTAWYLCGKGMVWDFGINAKSRYVIENYRKALDAPGEWLLGRDGYLYYIPLPGETPETVQAIVPVTEQFLCLQGTPARPVQYLHFERLRFEGAGYRTPPGGYSDPQAAVSVPATVMADHAAHIAFRDCDIAHTGLHAVWFRENCSSCLVERCHLYDLGGGGVKIGAVHCPDEALLTRGVRVHNNIIHHGGRVFPPAVGVILFNASDSEITHNEIADFRYSGVSAGWVWGYSHSPSKRNRIAFNHIHHLGWGELCDMGGVYMLGASEGSTVANNVIHHIYSYEYGGWGLYTDEGSQGIVMENNLVYACKDAGFHQHYGRENMIRNNIFAGNLVQSIQFSRLEEHLSYTFINNVVYLNGGELISFHNDDDFRKANILYDRNCYWDTRTQTHTPQFYGHSLDEWKELGRDAHSIVADPQFADPERFDFRIRNTAALRKIRFRPFDFTQAGVYGSDGWKALAKMPAELERAYDEKINRLKGR
ncbi:MAG: right-handed parallel beta-helix repeat-containing protein [Tannerella sp.]|jgi:hypothetical protein|nr:right-handed parallel beta-helix repeat-containing protein [Tannerella sp.]